MEASDGEGEEEVLPPSKVVNCLWFLLIQHDHKFFLLITDCVTFHCTFQTFGALSVLFSADVML